MDLGEAIAAVVLVSIAAFSQSLSGFGFALLLVPPLSIAVGASEAVVVANCLSAVQGALMLAYLRRSVDWKLGGTLLPAAVCGMPVGILVILLIPATALKVTIASVVLVSTFFLWRGLRIHRETRLGGLAAGFVSGVLTTSTALSGPPVVLYLQGRGVEPGRFRATLTAFFLAGSAISVALLALSGRFDLETAGIVGVSLPVLVAFWAAGIVAYRFVSELRFRAIVVVVLLASALLAIASVFLG